MLIILDGWGLSEGEHGNAVRAANTPHFERLNADGSATRLVAHGLDVGLPEGVMGNSEVGHLNIGAGRVVYQDSSLIDASIRGGEFFDNDELRRVIEAVQEAGSRLHLMGCTSDGNVHASQSHYFALLELAARHGLGGDRVCFHAFTDGRDTPPRSATVYLSRLLEQMARTGSGCVASVIGRYYAMDRDQRWPRVRRAYECLTGPGGDLASGALEAVHAAYERGENDEFIAPTRIAGPDGQPRPRICDGDAVVFFNYRSDRGRELSQLFLDPDFEAGIQASSSDPERARFAREIVPDARFVTLTRYSEDQIAPYAFGPRPQNDGLGETLAKAGLRQLRCAETEKYPHVTFFFSGGIETPWPGEERLLIASPQVPTYDLQPEMSAPEVTARIVEAIATGGFDCIVLNFANPDMVGHTGDMNATVRAVEAVDAGLGAIMNAIEARGGSLLVIADHGNAEQMVNPVTGQPHTAHTTNPVPAVLWRGTDKRAPALREDGRLADIAPTLLDLLGVAPSEAMTGRSLLDLTPGANLERVTVLPSNAATQIQTTVWGTLNPALTHSETLAALDELRARLASLPSSP